MDVEKEPVLSNPKFDNLKAARYRDCDLEIGENFVLIRVHSFRSQLHGWSDGPVSDSRCNSPVGAISESPEPAPKPSKAKELTKAERRELQVCVYFNQVLVMILSAFYRRDSELLRHNSVKLKGFHRVETLLQRKRAPRNLRWVRLVSQLSVYRPRFNTTIERFAEMLKSKM